MRLALIIDWPVRVINPPCRWCYLLAASKASGISTTNHRERVLLRLACNPWYRYTKIPVTKALRSSR